jgi:radical SAM superfamily enzyme YgiQ (UPF0313 family)
MKKILLVPSYNFGRRKIEPYVPLGIFSLKAAAKETGVDVDIMPLGKDLLNSEFSGSGDLARRLLGQIDPGDYDVVGFSTVSNSFHHSLRIAQKVKEAAPGTAIWMGGPHASVLAKKILDAFDIVDAVFTGESESTFMEVLGRRRLGDTALGGIAGIYTRDNDYLPKEPLCDLDRLPVIEPDDTYMSYLSSRLERSGDRRMIPIEVTRGCSGRCKFCFTSMYWGHKVRRKSDMRIISEMRALHEYTGISLFNFIGDNFGGPRNALLMFCDTAMREAPGFEWYCSLKLNVLRPEDLVTLQKGGCKGFFSGVESASQKTLDMIRKGVNLERELGLIRQAVSMGFEVHAAFIIGFPWETMDDIDLTFKLSNDLLKSGVYRTVMNVLCPLPGTELTAEYPVSFDRLSSHIAMDDVPMDDETRELVHKHPDLFIQLGHFETPHVDRNDLEATVETAIQLNGLIRQGDSL